MMFLSTPKYYEGRASKSKMRREFATLEALKSHTLHVGILAALYIEEAEGDIFDRMLGVHTHSGPFVDLILFHKVCQYQIRNEAGI